MIKEVKYNGYSAVPSDYECQDGDLAVSINLIPEDGTLRPILPPRLVKEIETEGKVVFIHSIAANRRHYIIYDESASKVLWLDGLSGSPAEIGTIYDVTHCNAVGNTLLIFSKSAIYYFLWKDSAYKSLGSHLPDIEVSFGLVGHPRLFSVSDSGKSTFNVIFAEGLSVSGIHTELSEANKTAVTEQVMAKVNRFIHEQTIEKGRFCFPFFVRYALRLYDGSLVCHSAPILMNPQTLPAPLVLWKRVSGKESYTDAECDIMLVACHLDYKVLHTGDYNRLDDWSDIVSGIEVFISKPIYTYEQEGKISSLRDSDNFDSVFIGRIYNKPSRPGGEVFSSSVEEDRILGPFVSGQTTAFLDCYAEWDYKRLYALYFSSDRSYPASTFHLPELSEEKIGESLRSCAHFYKLRTLSPADIKETDRKLIPIDDDYLQSLVTREVMTDDYLSHDPLSAESSYVYNSRLNLSGVKRTLFNGFSPSSMFAFTDRFIGTWQVSDDGALKVFPSILADQVGITVYVKEGGKTCAVSASGECGAFLSPSVQSPKPDTQNEFMDVLVRRSTGCFIFYPNVNATHAVISSLYGDSGSVNGGGRMVVELRPHDFLNGAYALLDYNMERSHNYSADLVPVLSPGSYSDSGRIDCGSKIYTSEVNNPFLFPVTGINTVGTGRILGICSAAKALSQGQFGQFPLYAFTTEGVWALEVASNGTFSARQPITRDVCINADGIAQLDSAVLFPTDRGIMLISGSQTQCISDSIASEWPFDALALPGFARLHSMLGHIPESDTCLPTFPFSEFLRQCRMIYDYVHQRVLVYAPGVSYAYVFSLESKQWGMTFSSLDSHLNSYPEALAVDADGNIVNVSESYYSDVRTLFLTRPLKLDAPNVHKTVDTVIQRGLFRKGQVAVALYGSRDLVNWHLVSSSRDHFLRGFRGTPFKYFRIAGVATLAPSENLFGASVQFVPRLTNRPR